MLVVAFLYSISAAYEKVGTRASSPILWAAAIHGATAIALAPVAAWRFRRAREAAGVKVDGRAGGRTGGTRSAVPLILLGGALTAIGAAAQMTALMLTLAAYVIAVKRTSTLFGVLLGHSVFHEERVGERLTGAAVMLSGFLLVTLA